ncbi:MAG: hypothetical protein RL104_419, partial [Bacteroidota bacterium]
SCTNYQIGTLDLNSTAADVRWSPSEQRLYSDERGEFVLSDAMGRVVFCGIWTEPSLHLPELNPGVYLVRWSHRTARFVVTH